MVFKHPGQGARLLGHRSQLCRLPAVALSKLFNLSVNQFPYLCNGAKSTYFTALLERVNGIVFGNCLPWCLALCQEYCLGGLEIPKAGTEQILVA